MRVIFVVPAHGRIPLARICLANLAAVCDELGATAVVIATDENADTALDLGFDVIRTDNSALGRRFNDGIEYAAKESNYVMPLGSDDLIAAPLVQAMLDLAGDPATVIATQQMASVAPNGRELMELRVPYEGGAGPRLFPTALLARVGHRPAEEARARAIDGSINRSLAKSGPLRFAYVERSPLELTDCKTAGANLNTYEMLLPYAITRHSDPWEQLRTTYPAATVDALEALYSKGE